MDLAQANIFALILEFGRLVQQIFTNLNVTAEINTTLPAASRTPSASAPGATFTGAAPHTGVGTDYSLCSDLLCSCGRSRRKGRTAVRLFQTKIRIPLNELLNFCKSNKLLHFLDLRSVELQLLDVPGRMDEEEILVEATTERA